jgi:hypothetical protein
MLIYLFFWYVILVLWARRSLPFKPWTWITRRFIRAQNFVILLALLVVRYLAHWTLRICHLLQEKWMGVKFY